MDEIKQFLQDANLKKIARDTGLARSTLQRIKSGETKYVSAGTYYILTQLMARARMKQ